MDREQRIILTREKDSNRGWAERLQIAGLPYGLMPLVRYAALPGPGSCDFTNFGWILFTSPQGVRAFFALQPDIGDARCAVLGNGTAAALHQAGRQDDLNAGALDGVAFAASFLAAADQPCEVLLPGPQRRLDEPRASLETAGYVVRELPLYETRPVAAEAVAGTDLLAGDVIFFCSPSAVRAFAAARDDKPQCVAIGQTTADACRTAGLTPAVAATPDLEAMVQAAGFPGLSTTTTEPMKPEMES